MLCRKGKRSCQHLECDYFLSYRYMKDNENVDIEISAKTKGWVAVGFSSDRTIVSSLANDVISSK